MTEVAAVAAVTDKVAEDKGVHAQQQQAAEVRKETITLESGEVVELDPDQAKRAMAYGVAAFIRDSKAKTAEVKAEVKEVKAEVAAGGADPALEKRLATLEQELRESKERERNADTFRQIERGVEKSGLAADWHDEAKDKVITLLATNNKLTVEGAIQQATDYWKKKAEKYTGKVDVETKEEEKKKFGPGTPSGKRSGEEQVKPLGRKSFRDGTLVTRITESVKRAVNEE